MKIITSITLAVSLAVALPAHAQFMHQVQPMMPMIQQPSIVQPQFPTIQQPRPMIEQFSIQPGIGQPTVNCTLTNLTDMFKSIDCM